MRIQGSSMLPTFCDGDAVLVQSGAYDELRPIPGDVVLVDHPFQPGIRMVKRVRQILENGRVFVIGDNLRESTDSRSFGALRPDQVIGRVTGTAP